jgi:ketosteroid isomerase-like protein
MGAILMRLMLCVATATLFALPVPVQAAPAGDAVSAVTTWLDKFNAGDMNAFYAAHAPGAVIVDEFAPYVWTGKDSPHVWADGFDADAKAHGISEPRMDYAAPIRADSDGKSAYIVVPTIYRIKQNGRSMSAAGTMTFVMSNTAAGWKIASWSYAAPAPAADR